jgi:hypothetical protein
MTLEEKIALLMTESAHDTFGISSFGPAATETETEEEKETEVISEEAEMALSPRSFRTLYLAQLAESMINEEVEQTNQLEELGLMTEGKITVKGKDALKKYLPTIFAS